MINSSGRVDRALGLVLRRPDDYGDPGDGLDQVLPGCDICGLGALDLTLDPQRAGEEIDVADLDAECFAAT